VAATTGGYTGQVSGVQNADGADTDDDDDQADVNTTYRP
jgi:hypothetical protein